MKSGALLLRDEVNKILQLSHDVALGKDYLLFAKVRSALPVAPCFVRSVASSVLLTYSLVSMSAVQVVGALYVISVIGSWFNFLTLVFLGKRTNFQVNFNAILFCEY